MTEQEQLEQAIVALEGQRSALGDAVVDAALAPMREKLESLRARAASQQTRRQITVLFADVAGSTAIGQQLGDPEAIIDLMDSALERMAQPVRDHGGHITRFMGDGFKAVFGLSVAHEDDAEQAVRAGLDILGVVREIAADLEGRQGVRGFNARIGINTGLVATGGLSEGEDTVMGLTVNLGARMESAAAPGTVLISHATYRQVRGIFEVEPLGPIVAKGFPDPVRVYVVKQAKPRAFRMGTRGIEGIETRMVGRDAELMMLESAFADAIETGEPRLVMVVGEAGVGKSRLLYEFENWIELRPEHAIYFKGRAAPSLRHVPYTVFRDMLAYRFEIRESDTAAVALEKFRAGTAGALSTERADLVGYLVGFDFASSEAVQRLIGSPDFGDLARSYFTAYVQALARQEPMVMFLEDLHWADDSSLDLLDHLATTISEARLLMVGLTRPELFERRAHLGEGRERVARLDLKLLSRRVSRALVDEILQKVDVIPEALRDLIVDGAEGNPFYVEELAKMLIDEGVIIPGPDEQSTWHVDEARLHEIRVPPTLTGILQARLDSLPVRERELLQQAAVVGHLFWDAAVSELAGKARDQVQEELDSIRGRELIFRRERSAFVGTTEYLFKHALLRDVTYETVLQKLRRGYHALVARWLEAHAGERIGEYAGLIAEHLEHAGQAVEAASYLQRSAARMLDTGALRASLGFAQHALALLPEDSPLRVELLVQSGEALLGLSDYAEARQVLETALSAAQAAGDERASAAALDHLGGIARDQGDWELAAGYLERSLALAQGLGDRSRTAHVLWSLGWVYLGQGTAAEAETCLTESQGLYQGLEDRLGLAQVLNGLASVGLLLGDYGRSWTLYQESLALFRESGDRLKEAIALANLGETSRLREDYDAARDYCTAALGIFSEIGQKSNIVVTNLNLGHVACAQADYGAARASYHEALRMAAEIGTTPYTLDSLAGIALLLARTGQPERTTELLGVVADHPALLGDTRPIVEQALVSARSQLVPEVVEAGLARGRSLVLDDVVAEVLSVEV